MGLFKKKPKTNSSGVPLDHLIDGELPFGWTHHNQDYLKPMEDELTRRMMAIDYSTPEKERETLEYFFEHYEQFKRDCIKKGECFTFYINWMYEDNPNSSIAKKRARLKELST